jgi:hypothetical protein
VKEGIDLNLQQRLRYSCGMIGSGVLMVYLYTLLHEGGHALVGILYGGKVNRFVLGLNAHVSISDAVYSQVGKALQNVAGLLLPLLFLIIALVVYQTKCKNALYHIFYGALWLSFSCSLLAWVIIPFMALFATPPMGDDITNLLMNTSLHPLAVSLAALLLIAGLALLAFKRGLLCKIAEIFRALFQTEFRKGKLVFLIKVIIGVALVFIVGLVGFRILAPEPVLETSFVMTVGLDTEDVKLQFEAKQSKPYSMDLTLDGQGILTDIQIYNEEGTRVYQTLAESFTHNGYGSLKLEKGQYEMVLTFLQEPQDMEAHFRIMGYDFTRDEIEALKKIYDPDTRATGYPIKFSATIK